jgi:xanthine/CO dehydrogenase XdhC/CoxF family maturation factor
LACSGISEAGEQAVFAGQAVAAEIDERHRRGVAPGGDEIAQGVGGRLDVAVENARHQFLRQLLGVELD